MAVQLGFIAGTLVFALLLIADRFSPRRVFLVCALAGATLALVNALLAPSLVTWVPLRFATGFVLAGIYPVGMKIASGWYARGLGAALGVLVGALVLGTASPYAVRALGAQWPWQSVMVSVAVAAAAGGLLMAWLVPDGPYLAKAQRVTPRALAVIWRDRHVRASALGYFGHMWELYAFFVMVPLIVALRFGGSTAAWWVFAAIGIGAIGCAGGGWLAQRWGSARLAAIQLLLGALCGLASPWLLTASLPLWALWLLLWGTTVSGDSPQFSALTATNAPREVVGSVLTFVNGIGFSISVLTISGFAWAATRWPLETVLPWLALGPLLGLWALKPLLTDQTGKSPSA